MTIDVSAVGVKGEPSRRSWNSKDALVYTIGIGGGLDDLKFSTENTKDLAQKVYPTFAVIIGGEGIPLNKWDLLIQHLWSMASKVLNCLLKSPQTARSKA